MKEIVVCKNFYTPLLGNGPFFAYLSVSSVRTKEPKKEDCRKKGKVSWFWLLLSIERSSKIDIYISLGQWSQHHSQWIADTCSWWNDYWQGENLHGQTVSFKWMNIASQNDATVLRYTFSVINELYDLELTRPQICWNVQVDDSWTTSCLGIKRAINNKPGQIFPPFLCSSSSA